jgi:hypothetical protein
LIWSDVFSPLRARGEDHPDMSCNTHFLASIEYSNVMSFPVGSKAIHGLRITRLSQSQIAFIFLDLKIRELMCKPDETTMKLSSTP